MQNVLRNPVVRLAVLYMGKYALLNMHLNVWRDHLLGMLEKETSE